MPVTALFIDEIYLRDHGPMAGNIEPTFFAPFIESAQDTNIQLLLGKTLYDYLQNLVYDEVVNGVPIPRPIDEELLGYVRQALMWCLVSQFVPFSWAQIRNKGLVHNVGETVQTATLEEMRYIEGKAQGMYEFYAERVSRFLCDNSSSFQGMCDCADPAQRAHTYRGGMYLGPSLGADEDELRRLRSFLR